MKYIDILNQTAEQAATQNNSLIAEEASLNLQSEIFKAKKELAEKNNQLKFLKSKKCLNFNEIRITMNEIQLLERIQKQLLDIQTELF